MNKSKTNMVDIFRNNITEAVGELFKDILLNQMSDFEIEKLMGGCGVIEIMEAVKRFYDQKNLDTLIDKMIEGNKKYYNDE